MARKELSPRDQDLVDYIISRPIDDKTGLAMSETACIMAKGWKEGSVGKVLARIREAVDERAKQKSADVHKAAVKKAVASKSVIEERALALANLNPEDTKGNINGQVGALRLLADMGGHIIQRTQDVTEMFKDWTEEELDHYARTREIPLRLSRGSGDSGPVM